MDLTNFNIFYILFLILAHSWKIVLAESEKSQIEQSTQRYGVWINKGLEYSRCFSSAIERQRCANFSLIQRPMNKNRVLRPDCAFLMHRLACSLYKLNCPTQTDSSFQMYDIPCQSSCHVTVDICGIQRSNPQQTQAIHWQTYPKRSAPLYFPSTPGVNTYLRPLPGSGLLPWNPRTPPPASPSVWPWRPYVPSTTHRLVPRSIGGDISRRGGRESVWHLRHEDCHFLPSGGCDDWARKLVKHHRYYKKNYAAETRRRFRPFSYTQFHESRSYMIICIDTLENSGCPKDFEATCAKMFPPYFTKGDWEQGNFTVALVMRVSQTFWWFGRFNRFQPFFRFNVKRTLKSDIVEYNDKIILTNAWADTCVCPNKLVVGKKYLLLTHSRLSRQTLRISTESVFLEKPKKYTRLILCWMGSCPSKGQGNHTYGLNSWNWRWQKRKRQ